MRLPRRPEHLARVERLFRSHPVVAVVDLGLDRVDVVHAGAGTFGLGDRMRAVALSRVLEDVEALR